MNNEVCSTHATHPHLSVLAISRSMRKVPACDRFRTQYSAAYPASSGPLSFLPVISANFASILSFTNSKYAQHYENDRVPPIARHIQLPTTITLTTPRMPTHLQNQVQGGTLLTRLTHFLTWFFTRTWRSDSPLDLVLNLTVISITFAITCFIIISLPESWDIRGRLIDAWVNRSTTWP